MHPDELAAYEDWLEREACESVEATEAYWQGVFAADPVKDDGLHYREPSWMHPGGAPL